MSLYIPNNNISGMLEVIERFKTNCMLNGGSLFSDKNIWTVENNQSLVENFLNNLDESNQSFIDKLKLQLVNVAPEVRQLTSEMLYMHLLCPTNTGIDQKIKIVQTVWSWSGSELESQRPEFHASVFKGVGSGGTGFNTHRWREFAYQINFNKCWFELSEGRRSELLDDGWKFNAWLESVPDNENRQFRHMLLFMLFPALFERIFSAGDRVSIVSAFTGEKKGSIKKLSSFELDERIYEIHKEQEAILKTDLIDFYVPPLINVWQDHNENDVEESMNEYFPQLIKFIAQSKTTDLVQSGYDKDYLGLRVKASFGQGNPANIPWISFLYEGQTTSNGIYPVFLLFKERDLLVLAKGKSETNVPVSQWQNIDNLVTIDDFYVARYGIKPQRYGDSYVYKYYDLKLPLDGYAVNSDLNGLISEYKTQMSNQATDAAPNVASKVNFQLAAVHDIPRLSGLNFNKNTIDRFVSLLLTKPFVILTGLSGSGKTKLAQAFSVWVCESDEQFCIIPVGADWTNREPLLGYPNALNQSEYVKPESGVVDLLMRASIDSERPYFLILDEMNLSHVERYFADFLSLMESGGFLKLHTGLGHMNSVPARISMPKNLFIIGTVNIDETTYMFSPKVLDRAGVIEFRVSELEMTAFLESPGKLDMGAIVGQGSSMATDFVRIASSSSPEYQYADELNRVLVSFFVELKKVGAEFGYRTASEIHRYAGIVSALVQDDEGGLIDRITDSAIAQKLLPKLHGSQRKLSPVLEALGGLCLVDATKIKAMLSREYNDLAFDLDQVKFPLSFEKIHRMHRRALQDGFTSFAEA